jgi:hypothetical protein
MSQENVELVRRAYELFDEGGPEALITAGIWSPEIVFDFSPSEIPGLGVYRGQLSRPLSHECPAETRYRLLMRHLSARMGLEVDLLDPLAREVRV